MLQYLPEIWLISLIWCGISKSMHDSSGSDAALWSMIISLIVFIASCIGLFVVKFM